MLWFKLKPWFEQKICFCVQTLFYTKSCFTQKLCYPQTPRLTQKPCSCWVQGLFAAYRIALFNLGRRNTPKAVKYPISIPLMSHQYPLRSIQIPSLLFTMWANITGPDPKAFSDHGFISNAIFCPIKVQKMTIFYPEILRFGCSILKYQPKPPDGAP